MGANQQAAVDFLKLVVTGHHDEAYQKYVDMSGKHHNAFTPAGFEALKKGMMESDRKFPDKKFDIQRVMEEGDQVATHSKLVLQPGELELSVVHWFRFKRGKIVEMWDVAQPTPKDGVNQDGIF